MNTEEILIKIKMIEEGILPVKSRSELYAMLETLTDEESLEKNGEKLQSLVVNQISFLD